MMEFPMFEFFASFRVPQQNWFMPNLAKTVKVQLTYKRGEVVVLKVHRNDVVLKALRVFDNEYRSIFRPEKEQDEVKK